MTRILFSVMPMARATIRRTCQGTWVEALEHEPARVDAGVDDVRLHGRALDAVGLVAPLDHHIGLGEAGLDVAYAVRGAGREVAMRVRAEGELVDYRVVAAVPLGASPRRAAEPAT